MRDFFKKLFLGKEPETVIIAPDTIPRLLSERESSAKTTFAATADEPIRNIRNAAAQLRHIVNTVSGAEQDPEIHPKLKNIAKNTLPQFVRSMNASLTKDLPEDPEEFYSAAVECVKGCLNSIKGPGRYLQIVFPEEMKAARKGIDAMGGEINNLTAALGTYRRETAKLHEAQELYTVIIGTKNDLQKTQEKDQRIIQRIKEYSDRLEQIERERSELLKDPLMADAELKKTVSLDVEKHRDETARMYASLSMTASHVLRKAEKIAIRKKHPAEVSSIQHATFLLSDHELPDPKDLGIALMAACPVAEQMIGAGELVLKNKEERAIFSDCSHFCKEICSTCEMLSEDEVACRAAQEAVIAHPVIVRMKSLDREQTQLRTMLEKEHQAQGEVTDWQKKTREQIPALTGELQKKVGEIMGKNVQFPEDGQLSA